MKAAWIGVLLMALALAAPTAAAVSVPSISVQTTTLTATYALYGNATSGWGFTPGTVTEPGPTITASAGENVTLRLLSEDGVTHSWFLAIDGGNTATAGEPASPDFSSTATPTVYSFTVPNNVGTYAYKCRIHPTTMTGTFVIVAAPTYVFYGSATAGWGFSATGISNPGPILTATQGESVELALYSADNGTHQFFVNYDGAQTPSSGEPDSPNFSSSLVPVFFAFNANRAGNFSYYCRYHPGTMKGPISIAATGGTGAASPPSYTVYAALIVVIVLVAIVAATTIRRKPRAPPGQPPATPPQKG